jgi:sarcosine oxidase subunit gamma
MPDSYLRQSALAHLHLEAMAVDDPGDVAVLMCERAHLGMAILRGAPGDDAFLAAARGILGAALPVAANTVSEGEGVTVLWLGPDEWLVVTPSGEGVALGRALDAGVARHGGIATHVTDSRAVIGVSGPRARDVLAKGCPLDLHPGSFGPGRCAQSLVAKASVLVHQRDDGPGYDLYVGRSFTTYLWRWLADAAHEYGSAVTHE